MFPFVNNVLCRVSFKSVWSAACSQTAETGRHRACRSQIGPRKTKPLTSYPHAAAWRRSTSSWPETCISAEGADNDSSNAAYGPTNTRFQNMAEQQPSSIFGEMSCRETPLKDLLWALSPVRLVCHGPPPQSCHGERHSTAMNVEFLNFLSPLREFRVSDAENEAHCPMLGGLQLENRWSSDQASLQERCVAVYPWRRPGGGRLSSGNTHEALSGWRWRRR